MIKKIMKEKRVIFVSCIILLLFLIGLLFQSNHEVMGEKPRIEEPLLEKQEEVISKDAIQVDIKGAVKNPGVYEMEIGSRVQDVISKSGGLLETAYVNTINLSKKLEDEMVVIIYSEEEIISFLEEETRTLKQENTCICPKIENGACVKEATTNQVTNTDKASNNDTNTTKQVSLNNGTKADFESLPGIGSAKADAIIQYRNEHGNFHSIEEIKNVSGIGEATFEKIKQYLTL